ncbi:MAG: WYL domain-containing transcriptional regulator [Syntrophales bacterium]|jgi:predicted DNA-binding transcriptional regulator YafY
MDRQKGSEIRILRLGRILRVFMEKSRVSSTWLSDQFKITPRTIQRDLLLMKSSGFPIHEIQKGIYELNKDLVKNLEIFDDTELALVVALKNMVSQLGQPFKKAADSVFDHLYNCVTSMPVYVKIDESVQLDSRLLNHVVRAIRECKQVSFQYTSARSSHPVTLEPYRLAYFNGFWYLIGNDTKAGILKRYALDKIKDFRLQKTRFKGAPAMLDDSLRSSASIWFSGEKKLKIIIRVAAPCSNYFRRRIMFPTQEIIEEKQDGSLIVSYRVGNYEEIVNFLKSWIPHITLLEPDELRNMLLKEIKQWILKQEKITLQ